MSNIQQLNWITREDVDKINRFRASLMQSGARVGFLQTSNRAVNAINQFVQKNRKVTDTYKTAWTILLTINTTDWAKLSPMKDDLDQITFLLNRHLNKMTQLGGNLWNFINTKRTTSQIASGIVLQEWDGETVNAWFNNEKELEDTIRTYRH